MLCVNNLQAKGAGMTEMKIEDLVCVWLDCLARKDLKNILSLYADEAALMPTLRDKIHRTAKERKEYFEFFLSFPHLRGIVINQYARSHGEIALNTGVYKFVFEKDGQETTLFARFSFTYKKENGNWLIVDHHSSAFPESC